MFVKICGITSEEDALLAVALGADALGFVFAPGSPRQVTPEAVERIVSRLPAGAKTIGVFRDERPERVVEIVNGVGLSGAQLHGREPVSEVQWVRDRVGVLIQGFAAGDPAIADAKEGGAHAVLIDATEPGSGKVFDWAMAEGVRGVRIIVAGGLTGDNVGEAIARLRPWGVDVSSGVETEPGSGRKDPPRLRRFIAEARRAGQELAEDGWAPHPEDGLPAYDWEADAALRRS